MKKIHNNKVISAVCIQIKYNLNLATKIKYLNIELLIVKLAMNEL